MVPGWKEAVDDVGEELRQVAAAALAAAQADLALPALRVRWFEMGDGEEWNPDPADPDIALVVLGAPPFEAVMLGKAVPHLVPAVIWLRADLSPAEVGTVIAHEARHVWQEARAQEWAAAQGSETIEGTGLAPGDLRAAMDDDANLYMLQAPWLSPTMRRAGRKLVEEYYDNEGRTNTWA